MSDSNETKLRAALQNLHDRTKHMYGRAFPDMTKAVDDAAAALGLPSIGTSGDQAPSDATTKAAHDVLTERRRQIEKERWTPEHDDEHDDGSLRIAAACYALKGLKGALPGEFNTAWLSTFTRWETGWFKPRDFRSNLIRAAALLLAEIERLDRAQPTAAAPQLVERKAQSVSDNGAVEALRKISSKAELAASMCDSPGRAEGFRMLQQIADAALSASQAHGKSEAVAVMPTGDDVRAIVRRTGTSASDPTTPDEYVVAGWRAALRAQAVAPAAEAAVVAWRFKAPQAESWMVTNQKRLAKQAKDKGWPVESLIAAAPDAAALGEGVPQPDAIAHALMDAVERSHFECDGGPLTNCVAWQALRDHANGEQVADALVDPAGFRARAAVSLAQQAAPAVEGGA